MYLRFYSLLSIVRTFRFRIVGCMPGKEARVQGRQRARLGACNWIHYGLCYCAVTRMGRINTWFTVYSTQKLHNKWDLDLMNVLIYCIHLLHCTWQWTTELQTSVPVHVLAMQLGVRSLGLGSLIVLYHRLNFNCVVVALHFRFWRKIIIVSLFVRKACIAV